MEKRPLRFILSCLTAALLLSGCSGMVKTTRVVDGKEVTVWTDPQTAKRYEQERKQKASKVDAYRKAEKRGPNDPIIVALYETEVEAKLKQNVKGRLFEQLRKEFEGDPVIKLVDQKVVSRAAQEKAHRMSSFDNNPSSSVDADVSVFTTAAAREEAGVNRATGKVGKMVALSYHAKVASDYFPEETYSVEESGNIFRNVAVTRAFAQKIKEIIKNKIGPNIPKRVAGRKFGEEGPKKVELSEFLKSMKKSK
jgi:hypothetical protein